MQSQASQVITDDHWCLSLLGKSYGIVLQWYIATMAT